MGTVGGDVCDGAEDIGGGRAGCEGEEGEAVETLEVGVGEGGGGGAVGVEVGVELVCEGEGRGRWEEVEPWVCGAVVV